MRNNMRPSTQQSERGITLLITLLFMSVLLGITATLLNISLKQYKIASIGLASEISFQASQAGLECAVYHDFNTKGQDFNNDGNAEAYVFQVPGDGSLQPNIPRISCLGVANVQSKNNEAKSGDEQLFEFTWGTAPNERCTNISVYKFKNDLNSVPMVDKNGATLRVTNCPAGGECTVIKSRGYNVGCNELNSGRVVERELTQIY